MPMPSGDGLVVRIRPRLGRLDAAQATEIARLAHAHGDGTAALTRRANLQLRGVRPEALPALHAGLAAAGLLDRDPAVEAARNLMVDPFAEPGSATLAVAAALEARLAADPVFRRLPAKFGFAVRSAGSALPAGFGADVTFVVHEATPGHRLDPAGHCMLDPPTVELCLAGAGFEGGPGDTGPAATLVVTATAVPDAAAAAAAVFLDLAARLDPPPRRMAELVARVGAGVIGLMERLAGGVSPAAPPHPALPHEGGGLASWDWWGSSTANETAVVTRCEHDADRRVTERVFPDADPTRDANPPPSWGRAGWGGAESKASDGNHPSPDQPPPIGPLSRAIAVAAPFGSIDAGALAVAAGIAGEGDGHLRLAPWRAIVITGLPPAAVPQALARLAAAGWIVDPADPRLAIDACPGAPACASAHYDTRALARRIAAARPAGAPSLHLSGCAKGCARSAPAAVTLVGTPDGIALVRDDRADARPVRVGLTIEAATAAALGRR